MVHKQYGYPLKLHCGGGFTEITGSAVNRPGRAWMLTDPLQSTLSD